MDVRSSENLGVGQIQKSHIIIKLQKIEGKKILKAAREKTNVILNVS